MSFQQPNIGNVPQAMPQGNVSHEVSSNISSKRRLIYPSQKAQNRTNISSQLSASTTDPIEFASLLGLGFQVQQQEIENVMVSFPLPHLTLQ
jgi:hypothetical protein